MLGFSQPERGRLCDSFFLYSWPSRFCLSSLVKFLHLLEHHGAPLHSAKPPEEPGPWLPRPRMEMVLIHSSVREGKKNPASFSTIIQNFMDYFPLCIIFPLTHSWGFNFLPSLFVPSSLFPVLFVLFFLILQARIMPFYNSRGWAARTRESSSYQ